MVGIISVLTALIGLSYNGLGLITSIRGGFSELVTERGLSYFYPAFYVMSAICVLCYLLLLGCGVDLIRVRLRWSRLLTGVLIFEIIYFIAVSASWMAPTLGKSVAAATGVANGGMMFQFGILFPLWAPLVLYWARRRLEYKSRPT